MKTSKVCSKRILFISLLLFIIIDFGCKKTGENQPDQLPANIAKAAKNLYLPYEVVQINYKNTAVANNIINSTVAGKQLKVVVINDSTLATIALPEVFIQGTNSINFTVDNKPLVVNINYQTAPLVTDAQQAYEQYAGLVAQQVAFFDDLKNRDTTGFFSTQGMTDAISALKNIGAEMNVSWTSLDAEQKMLMANYLSANSNDTKELISNLNDITLSIYNNQATLARGIQQEFCSAGDYPGMWKRYGCFATYLTLETAEVIIRLVTTTGAVLCVITPLCKTTAQVRLQAGLLWTAMQNIYYIFGQLHSWRVKVIKARINGLIGTTARPAGAAQFANNADNFFPVTITARRIQSTDASNGPEWISNILNTLNRYNNFCDKYFFLNKFKVSLLDPAPVEKNIYQLSDLSIGKISNSQVEFISIGGTPQSPTIKFKTAATTDQNFTFEATYNDGVNKPIAVTIDATLKVDEPAFVSIVSGNNQTTAPGTTLPNPLTVLVKDNNGFSMQGVNVIWAVTSGGGQVNSTVNPTDQSGQSKSTWKLGSSGTQTVTATVKKYDGSNVSGSPATFTAALQDSLAFYRNYIIGSTWHIAAYQPNQIGICTKSTTHLFDITINANGGSTVLDYNGVSGPGSDWSISMNNGGYGCLLYVTFGCPVNIIYGQNNFLTCGGGALCYYEWTK